MTAVDQTCRETDLDAIFPAPSLPPTVLCPQRFPGTSPEAVTALRQVLKENYSKHHIFTNELRHHNHTTHHALALYATGASGALIEQFYKQDSTSQRPAIDPPDEITEENFIEHLSDDKYYAAYVAFFLKSIENKGVSATLDEYIFSERYNLVEGRDASTPPVMLLRFIVLGETHSYIHVGYGTEFGIPGMVAEGLAMASGHRSHGLSFMPSSAFKRRSATAVEEATAQLASLLLNRKTTITSSEVEQPKINHAFSILANVTQDLQFAREKYINDYIGLLTAHGCDIWRYAEQWTIDLSQPGEIERKMEECIWTSIIIYAVGGWSKEKGFVANFYFLHLVTSSLFLPSLLLYLPRDSQVILLRAYFTTALAWWVSHSGSRRLDIQGFLNATTSSEGEVPSTTNPFLDIINSNIANSDPHRLKIQRALAHFSSLYGTRPKGYFKGTKLKGAEALDGSLFFRAARLTDKYTNQGTGSWSWRFDSPD